MPSVDDVDSPVTINEKYLYAMVVRLDALCNMMSSLMEHIAKKEGIAVENVHAVEKPRSPRKSTKKE